MRRYIVEGRTSFLAQARAQDRGVWLSTNERNIGFYDRFGFRKVGQYSLGVDNPTWAEPPVTQYIVSHITPA